MSTGARTLGPELLLGASELALKEARIIDVNGVRRLTGQIVLADLAYHKQVRIVYTTDAWDTVLETAATYARPVSAGLGPSQGAELWGFDVEIPGGGDVELAVEYRVNGRSIWDNNFRQNYRIPSVGRFP